ncbi:MAG: GldG family protein [Planctomycetota bacterium]|nr:MAG: GldG family protein [Planctomycetota bacterium]
MNRTIRAIIAVIFVLIIVFCAISIFQSLGKSLKFDITDQKLYTLSDGTKAILSKLNQPITIKFYYAKTAALKGPDQIRYFNNYYYFVKTLLEEYVTAAKGMIDLQVIDPRPFSDNELQAMRYGLRRFAITEEENFFFGLVVQTQFGVEKIIPFFSPERQNFVEYDISYLIDTAITRQKTKIGILSSLPVMGEDVSGYMAQMMRMQGQQPRPPWAIVEQLRQQYEVVNIPNDTNDIKDIDILLVIHPKNLLEKTLFAIDQFILKGGRTVVCVDPHCFADEPDRMAMRVQGTTMQNSDLNILMRNWGLEMPKDTFAGDRNLALTASIISDQRPEKIIGFLNLIQPCFNADNVITANLNQVRVLFAGVLTEASLSDEDKQEESIQIERIPLITTTNRGNSWSVSSSMELMFPEPSKLMDRFIDGIEPVAMGCLVTGKFKSSFPDGIEVVVEPNESESPDETEDISDDKKITKHVTGLTKAEQDCAVVVFADVDFITDALAYRDFFFGKVVAGDNSALLLNAIDDLRGSSDLISIRSRGNFRRPFSVVDEIEQQAETETAEEEARINAEIAGFQSELKSILASAQEGEEEVIGSSILQKRKELELKIHQAKQRLRQVKMKRRERIERLGNVLRNFNMLIAPAVILLIAIILGIRRSMRKRYYISHASDA